MNKTLVERIKQHGTKIKVRFRLKKSTYAFYTQYLLKIEDDIIYAYHAYSNADTYEENIVFANPLTLFPKDLQEDIIEAVEKLLEGK